MKNFRFNNKKIFAIVLSGFILINTCSCGKQIIKTNNNDSFTVEKREEESEISSSKNNNMVEKDYRIEIEHKNDVKEVEKSLETKEVGNNQVIYSEEDNVVIEEFASIKEKIVDYLNSENVENAKSKAKGIFVSIVDFLFYDGEIKGTKFSELTEEGKKKTLELATSIDSCIMKKFPTYKEDIADTTKDAYVNASELIKKGATNVKEFSKEKLGEENYNAIIDAKDELVKYTKDAFEIVGNVSSDLWNSAKEKIKNWYEGFRKN